MTELAVGPRSELPAGRLRSVFREQSASFSTTHEAVVATIYVAIALAWRILPQELARYRACAVLVGFHGWRCVDGLAGDTA